MKRLAALILIAFLPAIAFAKGSGHSSSGHTSRTHSARTPKPSKVAGAKHGYHGKIPRSAAAKRSFQASNPCPVNGKILGGCRVT